MTFPLSPKQRIGLYGGSFDPIHIGHLTLALALCDLHKIDLLFFVPAHQNPLKTEVNSPVAAHYHRLAMVELAIAGIDGCQLLDWECRSPPPSYTVNTLERLRKRYSESSADLFLLLGEDSAAQFDQWQNPIRILELASPLIGQRAHSSEMILPHLLSGAVVDKTPVIEVSSSHLRDSLKRGLFCKHLLPAKVLDYIRLHRLYSVH